MNAFLFAAIIFEAAFLLTWACWPLKWLATTATTLLLLLGLR